MRIRKRTRARDKGQGAYAFIVIQKENKKIL